MFAEILPDLKVIDCGNFISAPYCAKLLADLGAEVIKVEEPCGDKSRAYGPFPDDVPHAERSGLFLYLNRNKLGITANLASRRGLAILKELLKESDVLVEGYPPAAAEKLGITYDRLKEVNPRLIVCSVTPFGHSGPWKDYKAHHLNTAAMGGACTIGSQDREPLTYPLLQGHFQAGVHSAVAVMAALFARKKTGRGQHCDVSETDVWAAFHTGLGIHSYVFGQFVRARWGSHMPGYYPLGVLPCKDGYIIETAIRRVQWERYLKLVGDGKIPEWWADDPRFKDRRKVGWDLELIEEADSLQAPWLMDHTKEEIFELCREHQIPFAPVYDIGEVANHPHLKQREFFVEIDHPEAGTLKYPGPPFRYSDMSFQTKCPAPLLGEHNAEVYCGRLGYSKEDLVLFRRGNII